MALAERESELPHTARSGASVVVADPSDMLGHVRGPAYAKGVIEALLRGDSGGGEDPPMARSVIWSEPSSKSFSSIEVRGGTSRQMPQIHISIFVPFVGPSDQSR